MQRQSRRAIVYHGCLSNKRAPDCQFEYVYAHPPTFESLTLRYRSITWGLVDNAPKGVPQAHLDSIRCHSWTTRAESRTVVLDRGRQANLSQPAGSPAFSRVSNSGCDPTEQSKYWGEVAFVPSQVKTNDFEHSPQCSLERLRATDLVFLLHPILS